MEMRGPTRFSLSVQVTELVAVVRGNDRGQTKAMGGRGQCLEAEVGPQPVRLPTGRHLAG